MRRVTLLLLILLFYACVQQGIVRPVSVLVPPKIKINSPVAVIPFKGNPKYAQMVTAKIEEYLSTARVNGRLFYRVLERERLDALLKEIELGQLGIVDEQTAAKAGRMVGASSVIVGKVIYANVEDMGISESRSQCIKRKKKASDLERILGLDCEKSIRYFVPCVKRKAHFSISYKVVDVESAQVIYADHIETTSDESKACNETIKIKEHADPDIEIIRSILFSNRGSQLQDKDDALMQAFTRAMRQVYTSIVPHTMILKVRFKSSDEKSPSWVQESLSSGIKWIENDRVDRACRMWNEVYSKYPYSVALIYNLGVCSELSGDLKKALKMYEQADSMVTEPDKDINSALNRIRRRIREKEKLRTMM
jgi:curli biogenesis system outer membrane secretion channel CsgG